MIPSLLLNRNVKLRYILKKMLKNNRKSVVLVLFFLAQIGLKNPLIWHVPGGPVLDIPRPEKLNLYLSTNLFIMLKENLKQIYTVGQKDNTTNFLITRL